MRARVGGTAGMGRPAKGVPEVQEPLLERATAKAEKEGRRQRHELVVMLPGLTLLPPRFLNMCPKCKSPY